MVRERKENGKLKNGRRAVGDQRSVCEGEEEEVKE
jgi:hypothetical protein